MYARDVSTSVVDDPACPERPAPGTGPSAGQPVGGTAIDRNPPPAGRPLVVERRPVLEVGQDPWDALAAATPWSTPFSAWAYHAAWWEAYGANAADETLVVLDPGRPGGSAPIAILPLMRRHVVEPGDAETHTELRHAPLETAAALPSGASVIYMGATYHGDYATVLAPAAQLPDVAPALVNHLATSTAAWDAMDLRRLRCGDPAADALADAFRAQADGQGWRVLLEREDVCPVATIPEGADFDGFLATLGKKERHEIRRKIRRAEASGEVILAESSNPLSDLDHFIDLHQRRWGAAGLVPSTPGGEQSRSFLRRLFERFGPGGPLRLSFLSVGSQRIAAGLHFETPDALLYYNAGVDPEASHLSPGVLLVAGYVRRAIATGTLTDTFAVLHAPSAAARSTRTGIGSLRSGATS